jgi:hypothetical protein
VSLASFETEGSDGPGVFAKLALDGLEARVSGKTSLAIRLGSLRASGAHAREAADAAVAAASELARPGGPDSAAGWSSAARLLALPLSLESASAVGLDVSAGWVEAGFRELGFSGPARAGELSDTSRSARGFYVRVGELPPDAPEWAKMIADAARRLGVPGFAGDASLSADHDPLTGDTSYVINSLAVEGLFSLTARIDLTGLTRPLVDLAFGLPAAGEGGNGSMRARILASPEFRRIGIRGASVAFTDLSLARRVTCGWDMGPFRAGAILGTLGTASLAARSRLGAELNPAFLGKIAAWAMNPGSFTLSLRPVSPVTLREILSAPASDLTPYRKLLSLYLSTGSDRETPLLQ